MGTHSRTARHAAAAAQQNLGTPQTHLPVPLLVQWMATTRCPLACPHCLAAEDTPGLAEMPLREAEALIDQATDLGVREFLVIGDARGGRAAEGRPIRTFNYRWAGKKRERGNQKERADGLFHGTSCMASDRNGNREKANLFQYPTHIGYPPLRHKGNRLVT
jgi:hypothetical protein